MRSSRWQAIEAALGDLFDGRLPEILARGVSLAQARFAKVEMVPADQAREAVREAFVSGYRQAYWDGVADLVDAAGEVTDLPDDGDEPRRGATASS